MRGGFAFLCLTLFLSMSALHASLLYAAKAERAPASDTSAETGTNKTNASEEDDFSETPFTEYGEFNEAADEEADSRFFQYGRFFGVSLGLGYEGITGNRGALYQGGFPAVDFKVHYWFDFNFALDLGFYSANHFYTTTVQSLGSVTVNMLHVGADIKYYFPIKNLSAPVSFANPYLAAGIGSYTKTLNSASAQVQDPDTSLGFCLGGGLEFALSPHQTYFQLEGKVHFVNFKDTYTTDYQAVGLQDLTGYFYTLTASFLFTW